MTLITGASSGIGRALALRLAPSGSVLALVARSPQRIEQVAAQVRAQGGVAVAVPCDVSDPAQVERAHAQLVGRGEIRAAFLCAGIGSRAIAQNASRDELQQVMGTNFFGVAYWLSALLPEMQRANRGIAVVVSSLGGRRGLPASGSYAASKAALSALIESWQVDLQSTAIQLVLVEPYFVATEMTGPGKGRLWTSAGEAAARIMRGVDSSRRHIAWPLSARVATALLSLLPREGYLKLWRLARRNA